MAAFTGPSPFGWVQRIDVETLDPVASSSELPCGDHVWCGAILAPTDADLGHQVITDESVPARIRRILNVESGLNDGIAAPIVTLAIALAAFGDIGDMNPILDALFELGVAIVVGVAIGAGGRWLLIRADIYKTATRSSRQAKWSSASKYTLPHHWLVRLPIGSPRPGRPGPSQSSQPQVLGSRYRSAPLSRMRSSSARKRGSGSRASSSARSRARSIE